MSFRKELEEYPLSVLLSMTIWVHLTGPREDNRFRNKMRNDAFAQLLEQKAVREILLVFRVRTMFRLPIHELDRPMELPPVSVEEIEQIIHLLEM